MTATPPWTDHDDPPPQPPVKPAAGGGFGWGGRAARQRHAGSGTEEATERHAVEEDWHGAAARSASGKGVERHAGGTVQRHDSGKPERHGGTDGWQGELAAPAVPDQRHEVVPVREDPADDLAEVDDGYVPPVPVLMNLRFVNEGLDSLRDMLRFAREANYNMSHIPFVRAGHVAFFWVVTFPVLSLTLFLLWAFAVRLHRALTAALIMLVGAMGANRLPALRWLVPDWLDATTWTGATWRWVGAALLVWAIASAIALLGERRR